MWLMSMDRNYWTNLMYKQKIKSKEVIIRTRKSLSLQLSITRSLAVLAFFSRQHLPSKQVCHFFCMNLHSSIQFYYKPTLQCLVSCKDKAALSLSLPLSLSLSLFQICPWLRWHDLQPLATQADPTSSWFAIHSLASGHPIPKDVVLPACSKLGWWWLVTVGHPRN